MGPQRSHDRGSVAGAYLGMVLGEGHVADPVQLVLDRPVLTDDLGQLVGADVTETEVGDRVDGLGVPGTRRGAGVSGVGSARSERRAGRAGRLGCPAFSG
jgi:hypothetical protein